MLFCGLLFFLFLITIRPQDFISGMLGARIVFVLMGLLLFSWAMSPIPKKIFVTLQEKYWGLFFVAIVVSTLSANWMSYTLDVTIETIKLTLIFYFLITILNDKKKLKVALWTIMVLMTIVGLICIGQYYGHDITGKGMAWADDKQVWQIRGIGIFDNPNDVAYSVVLTLPFALGLIFHSGKVFSRIWGIIFLCVSVYTITITHSRGGYLAGVVSCISWFYLSITNKNIKRFTFLVGMACVLFAFKMQAGDYREDGSSMGRVEAWAAGMEMFEWHPIIGVGKDQFREHHERDSHNSYVRAGAELGFIGLYAFLGILYSSAAFLISRERAVSGIKWALYHKSILVYLSAYMVASIFSTRTYDIIMMVMLALTTVLNRFYLDEQNINGRDIQLFQGHLLNKHVFSLTIAVLIVWKAFLMQVW